MSGKSFRSRLVGGFGGAGGTLVGGPILQMLLGFEWPLGLFLTFESIGVVFIIVAIVLYLTEEEQEKKA